MPEIPLQPLRHIQKDRHTNLIVYATVLLFLRCILKLFLIDIVDQTLAVDNLLHEWRERLPLIGSSL